MKKIERDGMPKEVATEMLCSPWRRMTNRERKTYAEARQTVWVSEQERKPLALRMRNRAAARPIAWLDRERSRAMKHRRGVQMKYESLMKLAPNPIIERFVAALNLRAGHLDTVMDAINDEIRMRLAKTVGAMMLIGGPLLRHTRAWVCGPDHCFRRTEFPRWISAHQVLHN